MLFKIVITSEDIQKGIRRSTSSCPVCLAVKRSTGLEVSMSACLKDIKSEHVFDVPWTVHLWSASFDAREEVKPFSFDLNVSDFLVDCNSVKITG